MKTEKFWLKKPIEFIVDKDYYSVGNKCFIENYTYKEVKSQYPDVMSFFDTKMHELSHGKYTVFGAEFGFIIGIVKIDYLNPCDNAFLLHNDLKFLKEIIYHDDVSIEASLIKTLCLEANSTAIQESINRLILKEAKNSNIDILTSTLLTHLHYLKPTQKKAKPKFSIEITI